MKRTEIREPAAPSFGRLRAPLPRLGRIRGATLEFPALNGAAIMHKFFNACLVLTVLVSAFFLYSLEHSTRGYERQIAKLKSGILEERESIKVLGAEWSSLTRPDRLQKLAQENLKLQTVTASQFVSESELAERVPAEPIIMLEEKGKDVIGDILKEMQ